MKQCDLVLRNINMAARENSENDIPFIVEERLRNLSRVVSTEIRWNSLDQNTLDNLTMRPEQLYSHVKRFVNSNQWRIQTSKLFTASLKTKKG